MDARYLASVDLLRVTRDDFDNVLRDALMKEWDVLRDALVHFDYFKAWDEETVRECCILSKLKDFAPNEVINNDLTMRRFSLGLPFENYRTRINSGCKILRKTP